MGCEATRTVWARGGTSTSKDAQESPQLWDCQLCRCIPRWAPYRLVSGASSDGAHAVRTGWCCPVPGHTGPPSIGIPILLMVIDDSLFSACSDNIRLWNAAEAGESEGRGRMQFKIIPGHHGGMVSQMCESHKKLCVESILICPIQQWSIQLVGSSSVLAEIGDGMGKPRELYLYTTSSPMYKS